MTKDQLIKKYGKAKTGKILNSNIFIGATIGINENQELVYYFTDINYALKEINGEKVNYFD